jgi:predicted amidohydrolase YtcJ
VVINGRFSAVGRTAEIRRLATSASTLVDLKGMTVTPGFNDVHLHPAGVYEEDSPYYAPWLGPEKVHSMDELIAALKAKAAKTAPGQMVNGTRYQDTKLGRHPNRHDLDNASTEHPIRISHASGHVIVVNTYVLRASGITKDTPDPPGGSFDRDPDGMPNGVIRESARRLLTSLNSAERKFRGTLRCRAICAAFTTMLSAASPVPESPVVARNRSAYMKRCATPEAQFVWASCTQRRILQL